MDELAAYERRFRRAGLPLFIEGYNAREDVYTRAAPFLALVFLGEMFGAIDLEWSVWANLAAGAGGLAFLVGGFAAVNRLRGRPLFAVPETIGKSELAAFVLIPALLPLIFGGQTTSAIVTAAVNLFLVLLSYAVVGYGLFSILRWAGRRFFTELATSLATLSRAVPLLLFFALVLFLTTELWEVFTHMSTAFLVATGVLFVGLGVVFLAARLPREVRALERDAGGEGPPLDRRQRLNVGLVMFVSQGLQVVFVCAAVAAFLVAFGLLAVGPEARESWIQTNGNVLVTLDLFGERVQLTEELLRVSGGIAAFSGLYYAIAVLTDSTYRDEFLHELTGEMRETFGARAQYLRLREA